MVTATLADQAKSAYNAGEGIQYHSFSSINQLINICSLQFFFQRVLRLPNERVSAALVLGSSVDKALRAISEDLIKGRTPNGAHALQVLRAHLECAFGDRSLPVVSAKDETIEDLYDLGKRMIEKYLSVLPQDEVPVDLPHRFMVPLLAENGEALPRPLVGELDSWVKTSDGRVGLSDWKTSASRWPADKLAKDDQATAYLLAGEHILGKAPAFFRYVILLKTKKPEVETYYVKRTATDRKRFLKKVAIADRLIASAVYAPNDHSFACPTCPFRNACAKWQD